MPDSPLPQPTILGRRAANFIAAALLAILAVLLITSERQQSQTFDESTHLFAGFEYWKHADFGRNPEHPPFVKLLATLPLLPMGLREPPTVPIPFFKGQDLLNGTQFLYTANADAILMRGRLIIALFSLTLGLLIFLATREIFGPLAAVLALFLFTFEPNLLANGAIVTTDMPLSCLLFASVYTFYRYCNKPSAPRLALCAVVAALTIVTKHSGVLVLPTLVLLALVDLFLPAIDNPTTQNRKHHLRQLSLALITICIFSYLALWAIYGFRYAARPGQLQIVPALTAYAATLTHPLQLNLITFFARHHLLPEAYLYGWVDILRTTGTRPSFLFGHVYGTGQWFFLPAVFLIKTTLTLLILLLLVPFAHIANRRREFLFLTVPIAFFLLAAISSLIKYGRPLPSSHLPVLHHPRRCGSSLSLPPLHLRQDRCGRSPPLHRRLLTSLLSKLPRLFQRALWWPLSHLSRCHRLQRRLGPGPQMDQNLPRPASRPQLLVRLPRQPGRQSRLLRHSLQTSVLRLLTHHRPRRRSYSFHYLWHSTRQLHRNQRNFLGSGQSQPLRTLPRPHP